MCGGGHSISCAKAEEFPPKCYSQIVTETPRPWDRLPTETPKSYAAFLAYVALGARRSVREAAHQNYITWGDLQRRGFDDSEVVGLVGKTQVGESQSGP